MSRKMPKALQAKKPARYVPTPAEIANDPSLRYCAYRHAELVQSDDHGLVRFMEYVGDKVLVASMNAICPIGLVNKLSIRRP